MNDILLYLISPNFLMWDMACTSHCAYFVFISALTSFLKSAIIRILHAAAPHGSLVADLDRRYVNCTVSYQELMNSITTRFRAMPTFGSSTIRLFATNASEMKKLAACDFEDLLQVSQAWRKKRLISDFFFSAAFQRLKDYCKSHTTQSSGHYYFEQRNGMHLQTSATYREYSTASRTTYNGTWAVNTEV